MLAAVIPPLRAHLPRRAIASISPLRRCVVEGIAKAWQPIQDARRDTAPVPVDREEGLHPSAASSANALEVASPWIPPALRDEPSGAHNIIYKGPIDEDMEGGARYAPSVNAMWSNVPGHVRASFSAPGSMDKAPVNTAPPLFDGSFVRTRALLSSAGLLPARFAAVSRLDCYQGRIALAPYQKGQTAAYHYPQILVPREMATRFPTDMYVDPVFQTSDPEQKDRMKSRTLFTALQGKTTLLLCFTGQPLSGIWTGLKHWLDAVGDEFLGFKKTQMFRLHCEEGWFNRRTHQLTKFHLRRQVEDHELFTTFVYRGKWKQEYVRALHLYDPQLPVVLLLDPLGYVRWHAIGLPSEDATAVFRSLARRLAHERKSFL